MGGDLTSLADIMLAEPGMAEVRSRMLAESAAVEPSAQGGEVKSQPTTDEA